MFFLPVNIWAVLASAIASMVIGFVWYSPILFGKQWMKLSKIDPKKIADVNKHMAKTYSISFLAMLVMAYILAQTLSLTLITTAFDGALMGAVIWLGFVAASMINIVLFESKPWSLYFINSGYYLACLIVSGVILTIWI